MLVSVIVSTYNNPAWLEKVVHGFAKQTHGELELIVADDGSTKATHDALVRLRKSTGLRIEHVWQEDRGFRKCAILNTAIAHASADYLLFTDGDCIPRGDFVASHVAVAEAGFFLSGGYFKLPMDVSQKITAADIEDGRAFDPEWLRSNGVRAGLRMSKVLARGIWSRVLNAVTTTKATWNGHNSSGWKRDIVSVNGFDERMEYGGEDRELGERMMNAGIRGKQIRYSAICLHLDHARGYVREEAIERNRAIRAETRAHRSTWTEYGIVKGPRRIAQQGSR